MACSNCGQGNGHHDSMHCPYMAIKLFGIRVTTAPSIAKSASTGYLPHLGRNSVNAGVLMENTSVRKSASAGNLLHLAGGHDDGEGNTGKDELDGYASDGLLQTRCIDSSSTSHAHDLKNKGIPWSDEEHGRFLLGLQELGKGKWRGIARSYVRTRTPVQVASHAQKFFLRHSNSNMKKKRSSLFDMPLNKTVNHSGQVNKDYSRRPPIFQSLNSKDETMDLTNEAKAENMPHPYRPMHLDQSIGTTSSSPPAMKALVMEAHENVQSTTPHPVSSFNVDELNELLTISKLRLKEPANDSELPGSSISLSLSLNTSNNHFATGKENTNF